MGVQGLLGWIKKTHPTVFQTFPKRWASPEIRGKRIAIDGTLLTNRYHFATADGPLRGKGALVGWYNLIQIMRAHDIQPVAIWDEPGVRPWKADENRRRMATRALASARRSHEDERQERLSDLKEVFETLQGFSEVEQEVVRQSWLRGTLSEDPASLVKSGTSASSGDPASTLNAALPVTPPVTVSDRLAAVESEDPTEEAIERITSIEENLRELISRYRASIPAPQPSHTAQPPSPSPSPSPDPLADAVEHLSELEALSESLTQTSEQTARDEAQRELERIAARDLVDEKAGEMLPQEVFRETRRQRDLTEEEGRIIEAFLGPRPVMDDHSTGNAESAVDKDRSQGAPVRDLDEVANLDEVDPLARLDTLITAAPRIREVYNRALYQPTAQTHASCRELLTRLGVPVLLAETPYEAEGLAASLTLSGVVDWVGSEDSDVLAFGGRLLKNLSTARLPLVAISTSDLLSTLSLTPGQFMDLCVLMGNDASPRIPGAGPVAAFKLIRQYGSIEAILANEQKVRDNVPDLAAYVGQVAAARKVFGDLPPVTDDVKKELIEAFEKMDQDEVAWERTERWLQKTHGIHFEDTVDTLDDAWEETIV